MHHPFESETFSMIGTMNTNQLFTMVMKRDHFADNVNVQTFSLDEIIVTSGLRCPLSNEGLVSIIHELCKVKPITKHSQRYNAIHVPEVICTMLSLQILAVYYCSPGRQLISCLQQQFDH